MTFTAEDYRREADVLRRGCVPATQHAQKRIAAMLDAAAEMAQPKTCATCRWLGADPDDHHPTCEHPQAPIDIYGITQTDLTLFGCTLWTPRETP